LNPAKFAVRESCDSPSNPNSTPIIVAVDETGSMGYLATEIIKNGLGVIVNGIYDRKPVTDPHILLAAVGDLTCDSAPLQATQFEADVNIVKQIEKFYIEENGGGNNGESYPVVWQFALNKTKCDAIDRRRRKGYLFTIGDEAPLPKLRAGDIKKFLNIGVEADIDIKDLLAAVQEKWEVFHLIVQTGATSAQQAIPQWRKLLGERAVVMDDHTRLGEVIVSLMQVNEGQDADEVAASWGDGKAGLVVRSAVSGLAKTKKQPAESAVEAI
jgi:hypothetical protein